MKELAITVGKRIRNFRLQQRISQEELAERCGLHPTYIGQIERGEKNATIESIGRVSVGLGISLCELFENVDVNAARSLSSEAYEIVQSVSDDNKEKLLLILRTIVGLMSQ